MQGGGDARTRRGPPAQSPADRRLTAGLLRNPQIEDPLHLEDAALYPRGSEREPLAERHARISSRASVAAAQRARSLPDERRRRPPGVYRRRRIADRVCDRHRRGRRRAYPVAPGVVLTYGAEHVPRIRPTASGESRLDAGRSPAVMAGKGHSPGVKLLSSAASAGASGTRRSVAGSGTGAVVGEIVVGRPLRLVGCEPDILGGRPCDLARMCREHASVVVVSPIRSPSCCRSEGRAGALHRVRCGPGGV